MHPVGPTSNGEEGTRELTIGGGTSRTGISGPSASLTTVVEGPEGGSVGGAALTAALIAQTIDAPMTAPMTAERTYLTPPRY